MLSDCPEGSVGYDEFRNPPGLEQPAVDPVAFASGFLTGFFRGLFVRGATAAAEQTTTAQLATTTHGAARLADASRLGVEAVKDVIANATRSGVQRDGARVYIQQVGARFNVVVMGERGLITNLKTISERKLTRLAEKYGYEHLLP